MRTRVKKRARLPFRWKSQERKHIKLDEIRQLFLEQYRIVEWKKRFWMRNSPYPNLSDGVVEGVIRELELDSYSSEELTEFIKVKTKLFLKQINGMPTNIFFPRSAYS